MMGMEAGQSAFGDTYAWFRNVITHSIKNILNNSEVINPAIADLLQKEIHEKLITDLSNEAAKLPFQETD